MSSSLRKKSSSERWREDPLDLRDWEPRARKLLWGALSFTTALVFAGIWYSLDTKQNSIAFACNLAFAWLILFWFYADLCFPRRSIYRFWKRSEGILKHSLRFWRKVLLLGNTLIGLGLVLDAATDASETNDARTIAILAGAFLASFGWMYTRFEQDRADRIKATLEALKEHMAGGATQNLLLALKPYVTYCKQELGATTARPFSQRALDVTAQQALRANLHQTPDLTHCETSDQIINSYDRLALGVRLGHFEFETVELAIRARLIRIAFRYHLNIRKSTNAKLDKRCGRYRSQSRTWEHFLWLTSKMDVFETDTVDFKHICMPPDYIVGTRKGEVLQPPQSRYAGLFGVDWEVAVNGLQRLAGRPPIGESPAQTAKAAVPTTPNPATKAGPPPLPGKKKAPKPVMRKKPAKQQPEKR